MEDNNDDPETTRLQNPLPEHHLETIEETNKDEDEPLLEQNNVVPDTKPSPLTVANGRKTSAVSMGRRQPSLASIGKQSSNVSIGKPPSLASVGRQSSMGSNGRTRKTSIVYSRGISVESSSGKKIVKNISRAESLQSISEVKRVPIFRLNSIVSDPGSKDEGEEPERQQWDNPIEFLLSCLSMSVGLGNVWRFPFVAYENGGGAFLIPYLLVLFLIGRPLYLMELGLGQFSSSGSVRVWDMVPAFGGIGYGQILATGCVSTYFCSVIGLAIYYLAMSCYPTLPWTLCGTTVDPGVICIPSGRNKSEFVSCFGQDVTGLNTTVCVNASTSLDNINEMTTNVSIISSAEQFFMSDVLKAKSDVSDGLGLPDPLLAGCLVVCWLLIYLSLRNGVSSSGKVAYFTAIFPYVVLLIMLVRGLTLPGAVDGLKFFFKPQWDKLATLDVWYAAVTQSFFSLGVAFGSLTTFSSFNKFRHNTSRDALIISFADTGTSLLAGTVTFSILGHLAHTLGVKVEDVVKTGPGLAFVSYPEVLSKFSFAPQLFAILFFLMLITLGLGTAIGMFSAVTTTLCDSFPNTDRKTIIKVCCIAGLSLGLFYITPGGNMMLDMVDYYMGNLLILALACLEVIAINWIYGTNVLTRDFNFMLGTNLSIYWRFCWGVLCPVLLPFLLGFVLLSQAGLIESQAGAPDIPKLAHTFGWIIAGLGLLIVPLHFVLSVTADEKGEFSQRLIATLKSGLLGQKVAALFRPNSGWGPTSIEERFKWQTFKDSVGVYDWVPAFIKNRTATKEKGNPVVP